MRHVVLSELLYILKLFLRLCEVVLVLTARHGCGHSNTTTSSMILVANRLLIVEEINTDCSCPRVRERPEVVVDDLI